MPAKIPVKILGIGENKEKFIEEGIANFIRLLAPFAPVECNWIKSAKDPKEESRFLLSKIKKDEYTIALHPPEISGKTPDSLEFAGKLNRWREHAKKLVFIIGGAYGHSDILLKDVNEKLSLSAQTYSHQLIRLMLLEQLYRGFTILSGHPYHK